MIRHSLSSVLSWPIFIRLASVGINFLYGVYIAQILDPAQSGVFFLAFSLIIGGATFSRLGGDFIILKVASKPAHNQRELLFFLWVALCGFIVSAAVLVTFFVFSGVLVETGAQRIQIIFLLIATILPTSLLTLAGAFLRGAGSTIIGTTLESGVVQLGSIALIFILNIFISVSVVEVVTSTCIASLVTSIFAIFWVIRLASFNSETIPQGTKLYPQLIKEYLKPLLSAGIASTLYYVSSFLPILIIAINIGSEGVAFYSVASRLAAIILLFSAVQITVSGPAAASTISNNKSLTALNSLLKKQINFGLLFGLPIVVALVIAPTFWINLIFGKQYSESSSLLTVLVIGFYLSMLFGNSLHLLQIVGLEKDALIIAITIVLIWLTFGFQTCTYFGVIGVSFLSSIVILLSCALGSLVLFKKRGIWSFLGVTDV